MSFQVISDLGNGTRERKHFVCCGTGELKYQKCEYGDTATVFFEDGRRVEYRYDGGCWVEQRFWEGSGETKGQKFSVGFYDAPYRVVDRYFPSLGEAFDKAWAFGVDVVYLNGKHIDGNAATGDILVVRGKKWRISGIEAALDGGLRYKLEKVDTPAAHTSGVQFSGVAFDTPEKRVAWLKSKKENAAGEKDFAEMVEMIKEIQKKQDTEIDVMNARLALLIKRYDDLLSDFDW